MSATLFINIHHKCLFLFLGIRTNCFVPSFVLLNFILSDVVLWNRDMFPAHFFTLSMKLVHINLKRESGRRGRKRQRWKGRGRIHALLLSFPLTCCHSTKLTLALHGADVGAALEKTAYVFHSDDFRTYKLSLPTHSSNLREKDTAPQQFLRTSASCCHTLHNSLKPFSSFIQSGIVRAGGCLWGHLIISFTPDLLLGPPVPHLHKCLFIFPESENTYSLKKAFVPSGISH